MGNYDFLPLDKTANVIRIFAEHAWPLQKDEFEAVFAECKLSLQMRDPSSRFQQFTINRATSAGSIATRSYGIPRISFHPCDYPQTMGNDEATPIATEYMLNLGERMREFFGEPRTYHDEGDAHYFAWWSTPNGVTIKIEYGTSLPTITILGPSQSDDPADTLALPSTERCVELVRTWVDADLPLSVPDVHLIAEELGWKSEEASSSSFYSELPSIVYGCQPPCMVGEYHVEPDVTVSYKGNSAGQIDFSLADYLSVRSEADAFPAIMKRMKEVEAALVDLYGEPTRSSSYAAPFVCTWKLEYGVVLTLTYGQGKSDVRIRHNYTMRASAPSYPSVYKISHALEAAVNWANVIAGMQLEDAAVFARNTGWFPADEEDPREFYTPISLPGQATANIATQGNQVEYVHFTVSHLLVKGTYESHPDNALAALDISAALTDEFGNPAVLHHEGRDYRDWVTESGTHIRLAWNTMKAEMWIYPADQRERVDTITAPMFTANVTPVSHKPVSLDDAAPSSGFNTLQTIAFLLLGVGLIGYTITQFY